jgi:hypothetical protein
MRLKTVRNLRSRFQVLPTFLSFAKGDSTVNNLKIAPDEELEKAFSHAERREFFRKKLILEVSFEGGEATGIANTRDIGLGGFYMTTDADLREGTPLHIRMEMGGKQIAVRGTVVYREPGHGAGVRFSDLDPEHEALLRGELQL